MSGRHAMPLVVGMGLAAVVSANAVVDKIQQNAAELQRQGLNAEAERITANATWPVFDAATVWDAANAAFMSAGWCTFEPRLKPAECNALAASQLANETSQLAIVLNDALTASEWALKHPQARDWPERPNVGANSASISADGFLVANSTQRAIFVDGYNFLTTGSRIARAVGEGTGGSYLAFAALLPDGPESTPQRQGYFAEDLVQAARTTNFGSVFVSQTQALPAWVEQAYPGVNDCVPPLCKGHFLAFDVLNPGAAAAYHDLLAVAAAPAIANASASLGGAPATSAWLLANEPCLSAVNSTEAQKGYSAYLSALYGNSIAALNSAYDSRYPSFAAVPVSPTPPAPASVTAAGASNTSNIRAARRYFEWQAFVQSGMRAFYQSLKASIATGAGGTPMTHLKIAANHVGSSPAKCGLDLVGLLADHGIAGTDSRAAPGSHDIFPWPNEGDAGTYAGFFLSQLTYFPMARSLAPGKALFDSEEHQVSTVKLRVAMPRGYTRAFEWLSVLLGRSLNAMWYWSRNEDGSVAAKGGGGSAAVDSILTQPFALDEHARALSEATSVGEDIRRLAAAPRPVAVWFSRLSHAAEAAFGPSVIRASELVAFLPGGRQAGFVAERAVAGRQLRAGGGTDEAGRLCQGDAACRAARAAEEARGAVREAVLRAGALDGNTSVVVLPTATFAMDEAVAGLASWLHGDPGRRIVVYADNCSAPPTSDPSCLVLRLRPDGTARPDAELAFLEDPARVLFLPPGSTSQKALGAASAWLSTVPSLQAASCLSDGAPLLGLACWLAPPLPESPNGTLFAINLRADTANVTVRVGGKPVTSAASLIAEPPFGVEAASLPALELEPFRVAALRL